jgi:hypothetical protein
MSLIWKNSTKSGLCDRLLDLFIMASYSKLINKKLLLKWEEQPINKIQEKVWNHTRFDDYKIKNVNIYFRLPAHINILSDIDFENNINNIGDEDLIFNNYLGGIYSPITFYKKYIDKNFKLDEFINIFNSLINQFKPTEKLINLVQNIPKNLISIHLRRTDKSSKFISANDSHGVGENVSELNNKTIDIINKFINFGYNNFYFASDCVNTKNEYENMFNQQNIINYKIDKDIEQTYIDLYIMSQSKYIILSQKHSSFSLFASLINKSKLIFFYNDIIQSNKYTKFENIKFYTDDYKIDKINDNTCLLYFHQGWTDIINCLSLINYYNEKYQKVYLLIREDSKGIIDFYTKNNNNVIILYEDKKVLDNNYNNIDYFEKKYNLENISRELIGCHDKNRLDMFKNKFSMGKFFVNAFYECYEIDYINRIDYFTFTRDIELENLTYNKFINKYGTKYILYHEVIKNYDKSIQIINLNNISDIFFDTIKILENAIELHLLDSVWGAFIYQLDCKYKLFQNKKIYLYAQRGYKKMFEEPIKLNNWIII